MISQEGEIGFVSEIIADKAVIKLIETDACEHCNAKILCRPDKKGQRRLTASNPLKAQVGQKVRVVEAGNLLLEFSFFQFGLPLLGLLLGIFTAHGLALNIGSLPPEATMALVGLLGLIGGGVITWFWAGKKAKTTETAFKIDSILPDL